MLWPDAAGMRFQTLMSRNTDRLPRASILCRCEIGTRFPESPPIPSRVLIAIGPGAPPWGQLHRGQFPYATALYWARVPSYSLPPRQSCGGGRSHEIGYLRGRPTA